MRRSMPILVALLAFAGICRGGELPKYQLKTGLEIKYEGNDIFKFDGGRFDTETKATFWITKTNADGSAHVVYRRSQLSKDNRFKSDEKPRINFGMFDVTPDGKVSIDPSSAMMFDPASYFPRLPSTAAEMTKWSDHSDVTQTDTAFRALKDDEKTFEFSVIPSRIYDQIYGIGTKFDAVFDRDRGLLTTVHSQVSQTYGFNGQGSGMMALKSAEMKNPAMIAQLSKETDALFALTKERIDSGYDPKEIETQSNKLEADLRALILTLTLTETKQFAQDQLDSMTRERDWLIDGAKAQASVKALPPADWTAKDLDGKDYALKDYRGKVVLLDYWYRGCGWCMRAMPQVKEVAEKYKDKGVVVLGMNTDENVSDAKFVVDAMKLNYPVLRAKDLVETYKVNSFGFPTLIVIDQTGVVKAMHIGYSPTLKDDLSKIIDGLLKS